MLDTYQIDLHNEQLEYLNKIVESHQLIDLGKAIRCLINYSMVSEKYEEEIFDTERCVNC
jgi:hypothetical protein